MFGKEKNIYLMSFPSIDPTTGEKVFISTDERAKAQSDHDNPDLQFNVKVRTGMRIAKTMARAKKRSL